ncbi:MAG: metallophosphoesterase [Clostridia bacterium]|nr:metallophosphoesterase [Clostridia bacterium]
MVLNIVQQFFLKLFSIFFAMSVSVSGAIAPPATDEPIKPLDDDAKLVFAAFGDTQISNYMFDRYKSFSASMEDLHASERMDAVIVAGDVVENGLAEEYQLVYDGLKGLENCRYIMSAGNHDIRLRSYKQVVSRFTEFSNALNNNVDPVTELHFSERVNGYKFIVIGSDKATFEEAYISDEQLEWLDSELAAENGKPTFVICHQPLKLTHDLPNTWGNGTNLNAGSVGDQSDAIKEILTKYDNVVFITGHLHTGFGEASYEQIGDLHMVNVPALSIDNKDGKYNGSGLGYIVEVYDDEIIFRARNLETGKWLSDYNETITLK